MRPVPCGSTGTCSPPPPTPPTTGSSPALSSEDGDPLDALVLLDEPTVPGCHILARAIGVFWMRDEAGPDAKILSVPARDERWAHLIDLPDLRRHLRAEISHFFEVYKALEPAKSTEIGTWDDAEVAARVIEESFERYRTTDHGSPAHG